ncbi:hypothetical protein BJX61DRAFT_537631 [Aspergillus egyptiacus]|nr:hypothetical protein BJX61DRAFT_537631 [Aspergillus egyptiacus]
MSLVTSPIELLPNELLDEIISLLSVSPPSLDRLHQPPSEKLTKSKNKDLKNLSLSCSRLLGLVRPRLFAHGCFELQDVDKYLLFVTEAGLDRYVKSIVVKATDVRNNSEGSRPTWWRTFLRSLIPQRLTVVAPPWFLGEMLGVVIPEEHSWAFEIPLQVLQLEYDQRDRKSAALQLDEQSNLVDCIPWSAMLFNESSSLKAYNHYEYFLYEIPSVFHRWSAHPLSEQPRLGITLGNLSSFTYVAVFPFYNHVQLVMDAVGFMRNLRSLKVQLGPSPNNRVTELEQRGSMDPSDPWMELATAYSLVAHAVRWEGGRRSLSEFTTCDYENESVRGEIDTIIGNILSEDAWTHNGYGTWTRTPAGSAAEPAGPILAHSLLQSSASVTPAGVDVKLQGPRPEPRPSDSWNLEFDIERGLNSSSENVFRSGTVIGFSRLRGETPEGNDDEICGKLPRHLLTTWLRRSSLTSFTDSTPASTPSVPNRAFIIHPANSTIFSPENLLASLLSTEPKLPRDRAISHLDTVQLFPVFDFAGAVEAINYVSDSLYTLRESQQQQQRQQQQPSEQDNRNPETNSHSTLLIITGLDKLTEAVIRASNAVRGTAVLSSLLRTLTQLSRMYRSTLSVLLVNTSGVGPTVLHDSGGGGGGGGRGHVVTRRDYEISRSRDEGSSIQSMFYVDVPLFPSLLMRTLDQGIDTHLLVSNTRRLHVLEVIKDRVGDGVGKWCVWDRIR